jgi:hypothetical protein
MSRERAGGGLLGAVAAALCVMATVAALSAYALERATPATDLQDTPMLLAAFVAYAMTGAIVAARRPDHTIGWLYLTVGVLAGTLSFSMSYSEYAFATGLPGLSVAMWLASVLWVPLIACAAFYPLLLFPTGRPLSPRWRVVVWLITLSLAAHISSLAVQPTLGPLVSGATIVNPIGVPALQGWEASPAGRLFTGEGGLLGSLVAGMVCIVLRFRRSRGIQRLQLKWFAAAAVSLVTWFVATGFVDLPDSLEDIGFGLVVAALPITTGMAVLRHGLYDIDRIISRTVSYALLTGLLAAVYGAVVVFGSRLVAPLGAGSELATAAATLAAAALFAPARRRIQHLVDDRFNRARYDAQRELEAFRARLRDDVGLADVRRHVVGVAGRTVEPTQVSVWLVDHTARTEAMR